MVVVVMGIGGLFLNLPAEMKKVIKGTWQLEGSLGVVAINLTSSVQKTIEKRMIKIPNWNLQSLRRTLIFFFQTHLNC